MHLAFLLCFASLSSSTHAFSCNHNTTACSLFQSLNPFTLSCNICIHQNTLLLRWGPAAYALRLSWVLQPSPKASIKRFFRSRTDIARKKLLFAQCSREIHTRSGHLCAPSLREGIDSPELVTREDKSKHGDARAQRSSASLACRNSFLRSAGPPKPRQHSRRPVPDQSDC